jgi:2-oxoglutarate ferredoxin oxidoreductase subunit delta
MPGKEYWRKPFDQDKIKSPEGKVFIIKDRCKGCGFCVEFCPRKVLVLSTEFNKKGYHPPEVIYPDRCVSCDLCERICPEFAIYCLEQSEIIELAL